MQPEEQKILEELERITASDGFRGKPVMKKLLTYLVKEYVEGRSEQIKGYSIAVDVFGHGTASDADEGAVVRNNAVRLRALLKSYYLLDGAHNPLVIDVPKGGYVPRISRRAGDDVAASAIGVEQGSEDSPASAITVLPFRNLSGDPALDVLATGFSQALSDQLTRFDDLRVVGMTRRPDAGTLSREIKHKEIGFLLDGEVQAVQSSVKVGLRLINAADNAQLWSDSSRFDTQRDDLFDMQERISGRVASLVGGEYGHVNQFRYQAILNNRPHSLHEQDILLKHYHYVTVLSAEAREEFYSNAMQALETFPDSALINAIVGGLYGEIWATLGPDADRALQEFVRLTERAYTLNPVNQQVIGTLGFKCFAFDEVDRFYGLFDQGKDWLANSPLRLGSWAMHMSLMGDWERGKKLLDLVFENNVHVPLWLYGITCLYHYRLGDYESALAEANKNRIPGLFWGPAYRAATLAQLGRLPEAEREFDHLLQCRPDFGRVGRTLMGNYIKEDSLLEHVFEGFQKIGKSIAA